MIAQAQGMKQEDLHRIVYFPKDVLSPQIIVVVAHVCIFMEELCFEF